jgi:hypothetical protein
MDKAMTSENAYQFVKSLVELGGIYYVDKDQIIRSTADDSPKGVRTGTPPVNKPIALFKVGMKVGDYVALNPFTDILGESKERAWFTTHLALFPGYALKHSIYKMVELGVSDSKGGGYKANKFISKWIDKMDQKLLDEIDRIPTKMWAVIFYDKSKKTAQLQCNLGYEEFREEYKNRIRKSSWSVLTDMVKTFLQTGTKKPESLMYESILLSMPKLDAIMHLLVDILKRMEVPLKEFGGIEVDVKGFESHLEHLEAYREALRWFSSATTSPDANTSGVENATVPWSQDVANATVGGTFAPVAPAPSDVSSDIASARPAGIIFNDQFMGPGAVPAGGYMGGVVAGGPIVNPTFGGGVVPGGFGGGVADAVPAGIRPW